jgi:uncharacterized protein YqgV (UPF0045/DUF77 family)
MCENEKVISCEVSYLPLDSNTNNNVDAILDVIKSSGVDYDIGSFRTILTGDMNDIMKLIKNIYHKAEQYGGFVIDIRMSNVCGV